MVILLPEPPLPPPIPAPLSELAVTELPLMVIFSPEPPSPPPIPAPLSELAVTEPPLMSSVWIFGYYKRTIKVIFL